MWQTELTIQNNTNYILQILGEGVGNQTISVGESVTITFEELTNKKQFIFWISPLVRLTRGEIIFGENQGVYVDRGFLMESYQEFKMTAVAGGKTFIQTQNGGQQLLNSSEFTQGGPMSVTFETI
jgi:hypothetical protein